MKRIVALSIAVCLLFIWPLSIDAQSNQLLQGTQIRLLLLTGLSSSVARPGDPFLASVAEPVYVGGQLLLPAGARVNGIVSSVIQSRRFPLFRGQAAMSLTFRSIEVDRREIPVQMSIVAIQDAQTRGRERNDVRVEEGEIVEARPDVKGDVTTVGLSTGGGTVVGAIFSHVVRGLALGLIGGTAYVVAKKGREVELPAQTELLIRLDNNIALPAVSARVEPYTSSPR